MLIPFKLRTCHAGCSIQLLSHILLKFVWMPNPIRHSQANSYGRVFYDRGMGPNNISWLCNIIDVLVMRKINLFFLPSFLLLNTFLCFFCSYDMCICLRHFFLFLCLHVLYLSWCLSCAMLSKPTRLCSAEWVSFPSLLHDWM